MSRAMKLNISAFVLAPLNSLSQSGSNLQAGKLWHVILRMIDALRDHSSSREKVAVLQVVVVVLPVSCAATVEPVLADCDSSACTYRSQRRRCLRLLCSRRRPNLSRTPPGHSYTTGLPDAL